MRAHPGYSGSSRGARPGCKWSPEADKRLVRARSDDMAWDTIARVHFQNVSGNACRKRHERLMETLRADEFNGPRRSDLVQAYTKHRENLWTPLANELSNLVGRPVKWQTVEKKVFETGIKPLVRNARATARSMHPDLGDDFDSDGSDTLAEGDDLEESWEIETVVRPRLSSASNASAEPSQCTAQAPNGTGTGTGRNGSTVEPPARVSSMPISSMLVSEP